MRHESEVVRVPRLYGWLRTIKAVEAPELRMEKLELDESSHLQPTGRFEAVALDAVIVVLSQERAGVSLTLISSNVFGSQSPRGATSRDGAPSSRVLTGGAVPDSSSTEASHRGERTSIGTTPAPVYVVSRAEIRRVPRSPAPGPGLGSNS